MVRRLAAVIGALAVVVVPSPSPGRILPSAQVATPQAAPPRDMLARTASGTATVRGRVTSAATGQPLHRVRVTLNGQASNPPSAVTDTTGAFEITKVPAGTYSISAARAGYLTVQYGQRRSRETGRTLVVRDADVISGIEIALPFGAVLAGRITDEELEPYPSVRVEAMELRYVRGRRIPVPAGVATTDDIGQFRISGLEPGSYLLRASATETWEGDDEKKQQYAYAQTYFPGIAATDHAQIVSVASGQQATNLDFALVVGRAVRVAGVLQNASGEPLAAQRVSLDRILRAPGGGLMAAAFGASTTTNRDGSFEMRNLAPGEYSLYSGSTGAEIARQGLTLADADVLGIVLTPHRPSSLSGSLVTDEGGAPSFPAARMRVSPVDVSEHTVLPLWGAATAVIPRPDWTFQFPNIDGRYLFRLAGLPEDWMLKSVQLGDRDVTDSPLEIPRGGMPLTGLRIVLSRTGSKVSGIVADKDGAPTADSTVIVFAADPVLWRPGTRFVKAARPDSEGRFSIGGLPAGRYRAVAKDFIAEGQWEDADYLRSVEIDAVAFELAGRGSATVTLRVVQQP